MDNEKIPGSEKKVSRRRFLGIAGAGAAAVAGYAVYSGLKYPEIDFVEAECREGSEMSKKVLVAYASKCGSTSEVADAIGQVFCDAGADVDVKSAGDVKSVADYDAVVLGSCIRMGKPVREATRFAGKHRKALAGKKTAVFSVGLSMKEDTPESREETTGFIKPLVDKMPAPVSIGLFGGKIDIATLPAFFQKFAEADEEGTFEEGDWRDFDAIRVWAAEVAPELGL